ncbi:hypothetical protein NA57DRAFT_75665 [Rhizodiscina lignyota]|uniref:Uncharacterized protein n=1 Tax=Rhizodiscina lignyota TaxID=1504668 RepID=A0A9P4MBY5_9PEZI|nr:hypothetical protein NA57DRAFT_75665 [Rhizodiscina lignyota]
MQSTESSVCSIIAAFTSGLDVFKKLRERRRQRQQGYGKLSSNRSNCGKHARQQGPVKGEKSGDELQLSKSLRRGSTDVQKVYEEHARKGGQRYIAGDSTAQASLAHTLLKLNAGLVNIITSFLSCGKTDVPVDYRSLTSLSDASRAEAIEALGQLYTRLSRSELALQNRRAEQGVQNGHRGGKKQSSKGTKAKHGTTRETRTTDTSAPLPPGIAKVTVHTSTTHLAQVRPATRRKASASSTGSSKGSHSASSTPSQRSTAPQTPLTPPPAYPSSPPPGAAFPFPSQQHPQYHPNVFPTSPPPQYTQPHPQPQKVPQHAYQYLSSSRRDRPTSYASIMTDSTKLGEIPMRKWNVPFDFAEMERLNEQARLEGWGPPANTGAVQEQGKGGWFGRLFRRGGG